ncbi:MAG: transposase [Bacteroidota bacterium]
MRRERKHIRLCNFDYSSEGAYFITICTKNKEHFFGEIIDGQIILNPIGEITFQYLREIPQHFSHVTIDAFVMPNHVHCIIIIDKTVNNAGTRHVVSLQHTANLRLNAFSKPIPGSISVIIQQFKSSVKRWCNKNNHAYFIWQSRFHDHVIRDSISFERIKNYIINNPSNWEEDTFNN